MGEELENNRHAFLFFCLFCRSSANDIVCVAVLLPGVPVYSEGWTLGRGGPPQKHKESLRIRSILQELKYLVRFYVRRGEMITSF